MLRSNILSGCGINNPGVAQLQTHVLAPGLPALQWRLLPLGGESASRQSVLQLDPCAFLSSATQDPHFVLTSHRDAAVDDTRRFSEGHC